jgi:hypothetical protein
VTVARVGAGAWFMSPMRRVKAYVGDPTPTRRARSKARYRDVTARGVGGSISRQATRVATGIAARSRCTPAAASVRAHARPSTTAPMNRTARPRVELRSMRSRIVEPSIWESFIWVRVSTRAGTFPLAWLQKPSCDEALVAALGLPPADSGSEPMESAARSSDPANPNRMCGRVNLGAHPSRGAGKGPAPTNPDT